jgi:hypothetical protein
LSLVEAVAIAGAVSTQAREMSLSPRRIRSTVGSGMHAAGKCIANRDDCVISNFQVPEHLLEVIAFCICGRPYTPI